VANASASASRWAPQRRIGKSTISAACTRPPKAITPAWPSAPSTLVGNVTATSITVTVSAATTPLVGPSAQAAPAPSDHSASRATNAAVRPAARYPRKVLTASPPPAVSASTGRGRQLRWKVAIPAANAPNALDAANAGVVSHRASAMTTATPAAPRSAASGSSRVRSTASPERTASRSERCQVIPGS
jgi:hypothetical protein